MSSKLKNAVSRITTKIITKVIISKFDPNENATHYYQPEKVEIKTKLDQFLLSCILSKREKVKIFNPINAEVHKTVEVKLHSLSLLATVTHGLDSVAFIILQIEKKHETIN